MSYFDTFTLSLLFIITEMVIILMKMTYFDGSMWMRVVFMTNICTNPRHKSPGQKGIGVSFWCRDRSKAQLAKSKCPGQSAFNFIRKMSYFMESTQYYKIIINMTKPLTQMLNVHINFIPRCPVIACYFEFYNKSEWCLWVSTYSTCSFVCSTAVQDGVHGMMSHI